MENALLKNRFYFNILLLILGVTAAPLTLLLWLALANSDTLSEQVGHWLLIASAALFVLMTIAVIRLRHVRFHIEGELRVAHARKRSNLTPSRKASPVNDPLMQFEAVRTNYPLDVSEYVEYAKKRAARSRRAYRTSQLVISLGAILVTFLTGLNSAIDPSNPTSLIAAIVSLIVSFSTAVAALFKWREQSFNLQQTANSIEREYSHLELGIHDYTKRESAFNIFAERVEALKEEQRSRELQLELSPEKSAQPNQVGDSSSAIGQAPAG